MILVINVCKERLHELEFVKPVEDILKKNNIKFFRRHFLNVRKDDMRKADRVIICGTSLRDDYFLSYIDKFNWIKNFNKPILGICAGMQIIGLVFKGDLRKKVEIGFYNENFERNFLGLKGRKEVYHLHNNYVCFSAEFEVFCKGNNIEQAVKHRDKEIYCVLFHPEVRQKEMIVRFAEL
jgi:GMP synthase (glutamine-hydrolysing)